jgi:4-alpha-glucanotransferase
MGVPWEDPRQCREEINRRRRHPWENLVAPVTVTAQSEEPLRLVLAIWTYDSALPPRIEVRGEMTDEAGGFISWQTSLAPPGPLVNQSVHDPVLGRGWRTRLAVSLPAGLAPGYYDLSLEVQAGSIAENGATRLVVAPATVYQPPFLAQGRRLWGLNLPLYALKSEHNWGIGDFTDLEEMVVWAKDLGAAFVGVNPLHARPPAEQADPSPYSPGSRLFLNFLYLDLEQVPELAACPAAQDLLALQEFHNLRARLQAEDLVDYPRVHLLKRHVLEQLYQTFLDLHGLPKAPRTSRGQEFARYLAAGGPNLRSWGQYGAMADFWGHSDWRHWPAPFQDANGPACAHFTRDHTSEVHFYPYLQWLAETQLGRVVDRARQQGLPFTLYQDLALGANAGGWETWAFPRLFAAGAAMGAPPDAFNPRGQNWGLPPMIPERLRESGYQLFVDTLRANLPPGGMLRLDHVMALFRLFWVPPGLEAAQGAYVHYPARDLLAILALESRRRRTLIIGEDLGTVSPWVRRELGRMGVLSYRVFYFERGPQASFKAPQDYPRQALAAVTTHDLPTLAGYWQGEDISLRTCLGLYPNPEQAAADAAGRAEDRQQLVEALQHRGLLPPAQTAAPLSPESCPEELRFGVLEYLAQSRAALLEVRLEEIFGVLPQQNLPGTRDEHPNWRRKLPLTLKEMQQAPEPARLAARLNLHRGSPGKEE